MLTNRYNLPEPLVRAVRNDKYSRGESDYTVTQLLQPPQISHLIREYGVEEDVADRIWSLLGSATHSVLERAYEEVSGCIVEERFYADILGKKIGGQIDVFDPQCSTLYDYKVTSVWSAEGKPEWDKQLNMLRYLLYQNGVVANKLTIIPIFRDWVKAKSLIEKDYPVSQCVPIDIPIWPLDTVKEYMEERVREHMQSVPRPCTDEERWATIEQWALMKDGRKSAVKLHPTEAAAKKHLARAGSGHVIVHRPKTFKRCENYCPVAPHCKQYMGNTPF